MKLATWTKPGTNDTRIYFNGIGSDVKVFAVQQDSGFIIKFSAPGYNSQQDMMMDVIDSELAEMNGGERVTTWNELINLVK
jgi:hypothetical protein